MEHSLKAIDLFAGAGGFSLSAYKAGIDVLAAVELSKQAAETYRINLIEKLGIDTHLFNHDVNQVDIKSIMRHQGLTFGELDVLLGGPPCQGFSTHRLKLTGKADPRNQLLLRYFDFVSELRPKIFLVENVPGLLWKKHEKYLSDFFKLAKKFNYRIVGGSPLIINSRDYGVPQNRRRAFILGVREDVYFPDESWPPPPTHFNPKLNLESWKTASTVFERPPKPILNKLIERYKEMFKISKNDAQDIVNSLSFGDPLRPDDPCNLHMTHTANITQRFAQTPLNGGRTDIEFRLPCHEIHQGHKDVYGRILFHTPSNTITTGCNNPSKGRFVHPWENHGITLRHAARLQSFPDGYVFHGTTTEQAMQIGNAVPIELGTSLVSAIVKALRAQTNLKNAASF